MGAVRSLKFTNEKDFPGGLVIKTPHFYLGVGGYGDVLKAAISSSRDGGDKIFTASKGGAWEGQRPPPPHSYSSFWRQEKGG